MHYQWLCCCVSLSDLMSAKPIDISDHGIFPVSGASSWSYTMVNYSPCKSYLNISNSDFLFSLLAVKRDIAVTILVRFMCVCVCVCVCVHAWVCACMHPSIHLDLSGP